MRPAWKPRTFLALSVALAWGAAPSRASAEPEPQAPPATGEGAPLVPTTPAPGPGPRTDVGSAAEVDPTKDAERLATQGRARPTGDGTVGERGGDVFSDDWWGHARPILELHGYFRTRGELFHNLSLGRAEPPGTDPQNLWGHPLDHSYEHRGGGATSVPLCGAAGSAFVNCQDKSQASANLRLRLNPEIHISDNLRILSTIDLLDNLVLGSTPDSFAMQPGGTGTLGYQPARGAYAGYAPLSGLATTQGPPTAGVNGFRNSVDVQRAWAEYQTPVGQVRFGRMPHHWGMGMLYNAGDWYDADYMTNVDRIQFVSGIRSLDLYFGGNWDFVASGPSTANPYDVYGGQPYSNANLANVQQFGAFVAHRTNRELERMKLSRGELVLNGGLYALYRKQMLDTVAGETPLTGDRTTANGLERRGLRMLTPDLWLQVLWNKFRFEAELAFQYGSLESSPARANPADPIGLRMAGFATQTEFKAVEDKLKLQFGAGWASGDPNVEGLVPGADGLQRRQGSGNISAFRFNPAYYVDYIFFRRILSRVQSAYYLRPSVDYDFVRKPDGQKFGGGAAIIWSRASEFIQTPGNKRDLGVELDLQVYYQAKDGFLNDDPTKLGGFHAALQYGVFFPLGGLSYLPGEARSAGSTTTFETSTAQSVRLLLGVVF